VGLHEKLRYAQRQLILNAGRLWLKCRAALAGRRFFCRSLAGLAFDGLFVNSDMSVSCNCQDVDGRGQLGNLRRQSLEEILAGPKATAMRNSLAAGQLPIPRCAACWHLRTVDARQAAARAAEFRPPDGLSVENTVRCNLHCLSCCREQILHTRKAGRSLSLADVEIVATTLRRIGARYCGFYNLGEPFLPDDVLAQLQTLRRHVPALRIASSTNGLPLDDESRREAALLVDELLFSIDGVSTPMVRRYQRGGHFERAYENMKALVALRDARGLARPQIHWKYIVFRWNDQPTAIRKAVSLAEAAGVDCLQLTFARNPWYGMSWRFLLAPSFRSLGVREHWRTRCVWFRGPAQHAAAIPAAEPKAA